MSLDPTVFVHPLGSCETDQVGPRTRIWAFAHVLEGAVVGDDCNLCDHTYVEGGARLGNRVTVKNGVALWSGVTIEDKVFLGPYCVFTNDLTPRAGVRKEGDELVPTLVKRGVTVGANATIVCGVTLGEYAFIAAGAVVCRNVAPYALVAGVPAERIGWACTCGQRLDEDLTCSCGRRFRLVSPSKGLAEIDPANPRPA